MCFGLDPIDIYRWLLRLADIIFIQKRKIGTYLRRIFADNVSFVKPYPEAQTGCSVDNKQLSVV